MHLFKKSKASVSSTSHYPVRSNDQLPRPALAPPDHSTSSIESAYDPRNNYEPGPPLSHSHQASSSTPQRSQSHRRQPPSRPTVSAVAPEDQPRRQKKGLFVRPTSGFIDRSVSVKGKSSQPTSPRVLPPHEDRDPGYPDDSPASDSPTYDQQPAALAHQHHHHHLSSDRRSLHQSRPSQDSDSEWSSQQVPKPLALNRSRTDLTDHFSRTSPTDQIPESPRYGPDNFSRPRPRSRNDDLVLSSRPSSRQRLEPPSQSNTDMQQTPSQPQPQPQAAQQTPADRSSSGQEPARRGSTAQPSQPAQEQSRGTPTPNRSREEIESVDLRALMQKHEELREFRLYPRCQE